MPDVAARSGCGLAWAPSAATTPTPPPDFHPDAEAVRSRGGAAKYPLYPGAGGAALGVFCRHWAWLGTAQIRSG